MATSPLLFFYAVTQIGKAIYSAATKLDNNEDQTPGHALAFDGASRVYGEGLGAVSVRGHGTGSYQSTAKALGVSALEKPISLTSLWSIATGTSRPLPGGATDHPAVAIRTVGQWSRQPDDGSRWPVIQAVSSVVQQGSRLSPELGMADGFAQNYPQVAALKAVTNELDQISLNGDLLSRNEVALIQVEGVASDDLIDHGCVRLGGQWLAFPDMDDSGLQGHPFMAKWALLYALSRLARYHPREWIETIEFTRSGDAAPLATYLLDLPTDLPELAMDAMLRATRPSP